MGLETKIEGVLFYKAEPTEKAELARILSVSLEEIESALENLTKALTDRGVSLIDTGDKVQLVTAPALSELITAMRKDELRRDIGKAGAETLAIILYRGPVTRSEIDFVRGVNSTFILRNLLIRGLIERTTHPTDQRSFQYAVTPALLAHLGISKKEDIPHYQAVADELDRYDREQKEGTGEENLEHTI